MSGADLSDEFAGTDTVITSRFEPLDDRRARPDLGRLDTSYRTSVSCTR